MSCESERQATPSVLRFLKERPWDQKFYKHFEILNDCDHDDCDCYDSVRGQLINVSNVIASKTHFIHFRDLVEFVEVLEMKPFWSKSILSDLLHFLSFNKSVEVIRPEILTANDVRTQEVEISDTDEEVETIEQIVQPVCDVKALELEVKEMKAEANFEKAKQKKMKKRDHKNPKLWKKGKARQTVHLNSVSLQKKIKYIQEGIWRSATVETDEKWSKRPLHSNIHACHDWVKFLDEHPISLNELLQLHFSPIPEREAFDIKYVPSKFKMVFQEDEDISKVYAQVEASHLQKNGHHPKVNRPMTMHATIECMCDLWACAMRTNNNFLGAYNTFHNWICEVDRGICQVRQKFCQLHPAGVAMFYAKIQDEGIPAMEYNLAQHVRNSIKKPISAKLRNYDWQHFHSSDLNKITKDQHFKLWLSDTKVHLSLVNSLCLNWGFNPYHDADKMTSKSLIAYMYNWAVKPQLPIATSSGENDSDNQDYESVNDDDESVFDDDGCPNCENPFCTNRDTDGDCTNDDEFKSRFHTNAKSFGDKFKQGAKKVVDHIPEAMKSLARGLMEQLGDLRKFVSGLLGKIMNFIRPITKFLNLDFSKPKEITICALDIVRYYIIYINTESSIIHGMCIYAVLSSLGLFDPIYNACMDIAGKAFEWLNEPSSEPQATSDNSFVDFFKSAFASLISLDPVKIGVPLAIIITAIFGIKLASTERTNLGKQFVDAMKGYHFIGAGVIGVTRIFDNLIKAIKFCFEWVGKRFFNKVPEEEEKAAKLQKLILEYSDWATQVDVLSQDEIIGKTASNKVIQDMVEKLFAQGLQYQKMKFSGELPQECSRDFSAKWKSCRTMHNAVIRTKCLSDFRKTPFHIQLYGEPGIGKSTLFKKLSDEIGAAYYPDRTNKVYAKPATEQCDGYTDQPIWLVDDMFPANDYKDVMPLLQMVSNCPLILYMSHLETKQTYFVSEWMLSTTNTPWPDFDGLFCKEAIWRRRHILAHVEIDRRVKDPTSGKFDLKLFKKFYPEDDPSQFPHLKFTFKSPVSANQVLKGDMLPSGLTEPTERISYAQFIAKVFSRYTAQSQEEDAFCSSENVRLKNVKFHLSEFDDAYAELRHNHKSENGIYESNFDTGSIPRREKPAEEPTHPENLTPWQKSFDSETADRIAAELKMNVNDVFDSFVQQLKDLELWVYATKSYDLTDSGDSEDLFYFISRFFHASLILPSIEIESEREQFIHIMDRLWKHFISVTFIASPKTNITFSFSQELINYLCDAFKFEFEKLGSYDSGSARLFAFKTEIWKFIADHAGLEFTLSHSIISTCIDIKFGKIPRPTSIEELITEYHLSADITSAECKRLLSDVGADLGAVCKEIVDLTHSLPLEDRLWIQENLPEDLDAPGIRLFISKLKDHLTEQRINIYKASQCNVDVMHVVLNKYISAHNCFFKTAVLATEENVLKRRERRGRAPDSGAAKRQNPPEAPQYFTHHNNRTQHGYMIKPNLCFGFSFWDGPGIFANYAGHMVAPPEMKDYCDKMISHWGDFYLTERQWNAVFPNVPYTNGSSGITMLFLAGLRRQANEQEWFWENHDWDHIFSKHSFPIPGGFYLRPDTTEIMNCTTKFESSYEKFLSIPNEKRQELYILFKQHYTFITLMRNLRIKIINGTKTLFQRLWNKITGSVAYLWNKFCQFKTPIIIGLTAFSIIAICTGFGKLFNPESTSLRASAIFSKAHKNLNVRNYTSNVQNIANKAIDGTVRVDVNGQRCQGYKIYNHCVLVPWHAVSNLTYQPTRSFIFTVTINPGVSWSFDLMPTDITQIQGCDLALIFHENLPAWGDRLKYIKTSAEMEVEKDVIATIVYRNAAGHCEQGSCDYTGMESKVTTKFRDGIQIHHTAVGIASLPVNFGVSGAPVFLTTIGSNCGTISGFQSYILNGKSYFSLVSRETLKTVVDIRANNVTKLLGPLSLQPVETFATSKLIEPQLQHVGYVEKEYQVANVGNTEFEKTKLFTSFEEKRVPAILNPKDPKFDVSQISPAFYSMNKHGRGKLLTLPQNLVDQAVRDISAYYKYRVSTPVVLTPKAAISGNAKLNHIDLNTSPGLPWVFIRDQPGKKSFISLTDQGELEYIDPHLVKSMAHFENMFKQNIVPEFSMCEIMKDELRPIGKAYGLRDDQVEELYKKRVPPYLWPTPRLCKTRTITVMPMEYTILYRQYFGDFFSSLYSLSNDVEPYCVGINADSCVASKIYYRAKSLNTHGFDLDVSNWDGHFSPQLMNAAVKIVNTIYNDSAENQTLRKALCFGALFGYVQFENIVYKKDWGLPSGFPGTADINTFGHMILGYVIYLKINQDNGKLHMCNYHAYRENVLDLYYGDDRFVVASTELSEYFNGDSVSAEYERYGWPTTSAAKTGGTGNMPIEQMQFLKRVFIVNKDDPFYVHWAMDTNTIETLLTYVRRTFEPRKQFIDNLLSALDFACDWGEVYFNNIKDIINNCLRLNHIRPIVMDYHSKLTEKKFRYFGNLPLVESRQAYEIRDINIEPISVEC